jgi:hypothetical protein
MSQETSIKTRSSDTSDSGGDDFPDIANTHRVFSLFLFVYVFPQQMTLWRRMVPRQFRVISPTPLEEKHN